MSKYDYDLFVIGAGSGGVRAARMSASYGARVAVAEVRHLGGTCVNVGCIPKKLLVYASHFAEDFEDAGGYGWTVPGHGAAAAGGDGHGGPAFAWPTFLRNKNKEIERLNGIYERLLKNSGAEIRWGRAKIVDPHTVEIDGATVTAEHILVATGSRPWIPEFPGRELAISSDEAFYLDDLPRRVIIVGGGYIAVEFASILHGLGAKVSLIHRGMHLLRGFDDDIRTFLAAELQKKGLDLRLGACVEEIERRDGALSAELADGTELAADQILYATGRVPNTQGLGLTEVGVQVDDGGAILVDDAFRTSVPSICAIGDVIARVQLTPVAIGEAMALSRRLFLGEHRPMDYAGIPTAVFCQPNVGTVGLSEAQAREHHDVAVYLSIFRPLKHTLSGREEKTMMKLVVDRATDRVLGCHMVGPDAGEIIQGFAVALKCGATKAQFDATVGIHPTAAEEFVTMREPLRNTDRSPAIGRAPSSA
ncbi:glutathione reductase [Sorangium cellulosum]|uniref:Glutathione reductase n=1 Tax=Sorangium cellulosum TaxID=56 RepID=A0A2L0F407_SORCE|nr:glutathione-disulfide reductase [Sorangium cellulosum]AUX46300.1 glutathione reductase [Sorangium cellulosum]